MCIMVDDPLLLSQASQTKAAVASSLSLSLISSLALAIVTELSSARWPDVMIVSCLC